MLGSAVSSSTPRDFQPSPLMGHLGSCPLMNRHAAARPAMGCPYAAVGMQRALDSAIGLPRRSTSASWMLGFLMPAEVRRSFMPASWRRYRVDVLAADGSVRARDRQTTENSPAAPLSRPFTIVRVASFVP